MEREEILAKSRAENRNRDIYEQEILKQANAYALIVMLVFATVFLSIQILTGGGINYGLYALAFSGNMTAAWVKYLRMRRKNDLLRAVALTVFVLALSGCHVYNLAVMG